MSEEKESIGGGFEYALHCPKCENYNFINKGSMGKPTDNDISYNERPDNPKSIVKNGEYKCPVCDITFKLKFEVINNKTPSEDEIPNLVVSPDDIKNRNFKTLDELLEKNSTVEELDNDKNLNNKQKEIIEKHKEDIEEYSDVFDAIAEAERSDIVDEDTDVANRIGANNKTIEIIAKEILGINIEDKDN